MFMRLIALFLFLPWVWTTAAEARRVALVVGQSNYTAGLSALSNPRNDASRLASLLTAHGFDVLSCDDGKTRGCYDLDGGQLASALDRLQAEAGAADTALAFFAGHGVATPQGNVLAPIDASLDCATGAVAKGVLFEHLMRAVAPAKRKLVVVDACRDNPLAVACPGLDQRSLSLSRIEAGALQGFLLVTSTQFGQQALDGPAGQHSPFASALIASLEASPKVYFDQVMNEVARVTHETAQQQFGFLQIPGRVVGGAAPADCLAGKDCIGDTRMAALAVENEKLAGDAAGVRNILAEEERARGKPYTAGERRSRVATLEATLKSIGQSGDPLRQQAKVLFTAGDVAGGQAKLDLALDTDEKAILEAERVAEEKRKSAATSARDLAQLARGRDVAKALVYYERATRLDPSDADTWLQLGNTARPAGRLSVAKAAFETATAKAGASPSTRFWATLGIGDVAVAEGNLDSAAKTFEKAAAIARNADPAGNDRKWQRDLSAAIERNGDALLVQGQRVAAGTAYGEMYSLRAKLASQPIAPPAAQHDLALAQNKFGDVLSLLGKSKAALALFDNSAQITQRLAAAEPSNLNLQRDYSIAVERGGDVLAATGRLTEALARFEAMSAIRRKLATADPGNTLWQRDLSVGLNKIGDAQLQLGRNDDAAKTFQDSLLVMSRLAATDPSNAIWQRDIAISSERIGDVHMARRDYANASRAFDASVSIAARLAAADPGNTQWQRDHHVFVNKLGDVELAQGRVADAARMYVRSLAIIEPLAKKDPGNTTWKRDLALTNNKAGDAAKALSQFESAVGFYTVGQKLLGELAKADGGNAAAVVDVATTMWRIGSVRMAQNNPIEALRLFAEGRAMVAPLITANGNPAWSRVVQVFDQSIAQAQTQTLGQTPLPAPAQSQPQVQIAPRTAKQP